MDALTEAVPAAHRIGVMEAGGYGIPVADGGREGRKRGCGYIRSYLRGWVAVCRMAAMASTVSRCPAATLITRS
jgi:hypothetical protein